MGLPPSYSAGQAKRRPIIVPASGVSSPLQRPTPSQRLLRFRSHSYDQDDDCSPSAKASPTSRHSPKKERKPPTTKRFKVRNMAEAARAWIDVETIHFGDEESNGGGLPKGGEGEEGKNIMGGFVTDLPASWPRSLSRSKVFPNSCHQASTLLRRRCNTKWNYQQQIAACAAYNQINTLQHVIQVQGPSHPR